MPALKSAKIIDKIFSLIQRMSILDYTKRMSFTGHGKAQLLVKFICLIALYGKEIIW